VLVCSRGSEALNIEEKHSNPIQLMITDVVMPGGMNGIQLADRMAERRPEMKVLYISGYADGSLFTSEEKDAPVQLLEKPFSPLLLIQKVRELLAEDVAPGNRV
jgi:DNA-binding NtrC family response regulator